MLKHTDTRRAILDLGESFITERGFNGFSYADIAAELGVKNAAIHYHFPTKEALGCEVLQRSRDRFQLWINNARVKDLAPEARLDWFFRIYSETRAGHGRVCLAGALETEFNAIPVALRQQAEALTRELLAWLETVLEEGRQAGVFRFGGEASGKAALILASLQGGLQMARVLGARKFQAVLNQHKQDLLV